ncbi:formyltransferase family protein [Pseudomonas sp. BF-B-27]|uniref:formyltransferase family protein n=1 Tax=Pseudomonas sp. BF-B-27 TaxID=2832354 RepID=UPI001CBAB130|nr:formyltransferase family protein [Pseudomonas sp. BF-B-27]
MKITLLCSDEQHPVNNHLLRWIKLNCDSHQIALTRKKSELPGGDILFLISCSEIVNAQDRAKYRSCLVLHASDLPRGRGWSPHIWQIIEGAHEITLTLLEAEDSVDSGKIWSQISFPLPKHALWNELNERLFDAEIELIDFAVENYEKIEPRPQNLDIKPTYYTRRTPEDSRLDPDNSIASQFNKIRVCDPKRFPAFFELHGHRYKISLEKISD